MVSSEMNTKNKKKTSGNDLLMGGNFKNGYEGFIKDQHYFGKKRVSILYVLENTYKQICGCYCNIPFHSFNDFREFVT